MDEDEVFQENNICIKSRTFPQIELQHSGGVAVQVVDEDSPHVNDCQCVFPYFPELAVVLSKRLLSRNGNLPHPRGELALIFSHIVQEKIEGVFFF